MITEYHRPQTIEEAIQLLLKPDTLPLGGGTVLNQPTPVSFSVVDLQSLGLNKIRKLGEKLEIGATATLSQLLESAHTYPALAETLLLEAPLNLRNAGTVAGTIVTCDGRSPFVTALLALDARLTVDGGQSTADVPQSRVYGLGDLFPLRTESLRGKIITNIELPLNAKLAFESVARTPADRPIVCAALARWPSGRTRLALGGWGNSPLLAMDGNEPAPTDSVQAAARNTFAEATDEWASAEYRSEIAAVLAKRCLEKIF
jgi:CO/xanthine dehydrogenase FAD-binding subunit